MDGGFRRLVHGLDTLQVAYYLTCDREAEFSFERLLLAKERLRASKQRAGTPVEIAGLSFLLRRSGSGSGYPLVLDGRQYTIECGESNNPSFFVTFRSEGLWHAGAAAIHRQFLEWARSAGLAPRRAEAVSRADFAFDYQVAPVDFDADDMLSLSAKDAVYREDGRLQTLMFGKGDVVLRLYDKVTEIEQQSDKVWLFDLWGVKADVWRIEWQVRKAVLRRFGIRSLEDLFENRADLLRYLATEHDSLRRATSDSNRSRWPFHPLWKDLIGQIEAFNAHGLYRECNEAAILGERELRIAMSIYGYLKRSAAILAIRDAEEDVSLDRAWQRQRELLRDIHEPLTWELDVAAKRQRMLLGKD